MTFQAIIFDAYGTLFDVYSIGALAERLFPGKGTALAEVWRDKQLDYTRLRTLCNTYKPFWNVTEDALRFACRKLELDLTPHAQQQLMNEYAQLPAFPENLQVLKQLKAQGLTLAILSNGNPEMLDVAVRGAGMEDVLDHVLSVHAVQKFKTAPEAYQLGIDTLGHAAKDVLFVSSNSWDICGASWFGYKTFWVNRANAPMEELGVTPHAEGRTLTDLLQFAEQSRNPIARQGRPF